MVRALWLHTEVVVAVTLMLLVLAGAAPVEAEEREELRSAESAHLVEGDAPATPEEREEPGSGAESSPKSAHLAEGDASVEPVAEGDASVEPVAEPDASVEPVAEPEESASEIDTRPASVRLAEGDASRPWGLHVVLKHSLGTGAFLADDTLRGSRAYVAQDWDIRPSYSFDAYGHRLRVMARFLFELEYTEPDGNPPRRFKPSDASVYLTDANVYTEPWTKVRFNAGLRWFFPTSYESLNVTNRWGAVTLFGGASRSFGPVYLSYGLSFTKNFNSSKGKNGYSDVPARQLGAGILVGAGPADPGASFPDGLATSFSVTNRFGITYNIDDSLSVSYSLLIWNTFEYAQDDVNVEDELTSPFADAGRGQSDRLRPTLEVTWAVDGVLEPWVDLPFSVLVSLGITALHPAQTADNSDIMWPFFYQAFADGRAADNYGAVFFDITGVY